MKVFIYILVLLMVFVAESAVTYTIYLILNHPNKHAFWTGVVVSMFFLLLNAELVRLGIKYASGKNDQV